jgi:hypothetical protein
MTIYKGTAHRARRSAVRRMALVLPEVETLRGTFGVLGR